MPVSESLFNEKSGLQPAVLLRKTTPQVPSCELLRNFSAQLFCKTRLGDRSGAALGQKTFGSIKIGRMKENFDSIKNLTPPTPCISESCIKLKIN